MPSQHTCLACRRIFTKRGTRPYLYCSVACSHILKRAENRQCSTCGADFWPKLKERYCSRQCWAKRPQPIALRLWAKVNKNGPLPEHHPELGPCWIRTAAGSTGGYTHLRRDGALVKASHVAWELASGETVPADRDLCHTCDTPACIRNDSPGTYEVGGRLLPRWGHLFVGTTKDNIDDMVQKGRQRTLTGEAHANARLTKADVLAIRATPARAGITRQALATHYGISLSHLKRVLRGTAWAHV